MEPKNQLYLTLRSLWSMLKVYILPVRWRVCYQEILASLKFNFHLLCWHAERNQSLRRGAYTLGDKSMKATLTARSACRSSASNSNIAENVQAQDS
ncbi:hypothetical protein LshimejAT787_1103010 [Lyophyllum shimeji]|uniref:Uncharacterized protein n=1 Tax=Lyophyllum shimeji TaxID=47721 RepID=A0A9P3PW41_LYOSH|nr:hypothetical protein LshimejAT787_1103010 [Lyophyllum shimeji]